MIMRRRKKYLSYFDPIINCQTADDGLLMMKHSPAASIICHRSINLSFSQIFSRIKIVFYKTSQLTSIRTDNHAGIRFINVEIMQILQE